MRVIACNYSNVCSQSSQPQGNVAEASPSNDTQDSLTLYLAQQLINQSNSEEVDTIIILHCGINCREMS